MSVFGTSVKRREDPALVQGKRPYTDDLQRPHMTYASVVRSPYAHAKINSIDTSAAKAAPGVLGVYTFEDVKKAGLPGNIPTAWLLDSLKTPEQPILADGAVRWAGQGVAVVVAEDRYQARDAADLVEVDYDPLGAVTDPKAAGDDGAPQLWDDAPGNLAFDWELGDADAVARGFENAAHVARLDLRNNRLIPHAIEPRAAMAEWDSSSGELTLYVTSQNPHVHRLLMSLASLGLPEHKMRVICPAVGGGFGSKIHHYPDEAVAAFCAMQLERPVKWTATRSETNLTDAHGRDHRTQAEMALDENGKILAFKIDTWANMGAYLSTFAPAVPTYLYGTLMSGQYDMPAIHVRTRGTFTNTSPVDAYRGAGRPEATYVVERMMNAAARVTGLDPAEIRRRNFVPSDAFPYQTQVALQYDSGNYEPALDKALEMVGYDKLRKEQQERRGRRDAKLLGIGISAYIEACGLAPSQVVGSLGAQAGLWESAKVRVHPTGTVTVYSGTSSHGQGHETTYAQIVADRLGIDMDNVDIIQSDTEKVQFGMGTYGSRSASVGGSAIVKAIEKVVAKGKKLAAHMLEASEDDIEFEGGEYKVKGAPGSSKAWGDVVLQAYLAHDIPDDFEPGLEATAFYNPENFTYPFGVHIAVVEIDQDTGELDLVRYIAVDDVGNVINPMIVDGQVHGGIAQGVGQALWEDAVYDEGGQLVTATLMDYGLPRAHYLPSYETDRTTTPCPHNPLGVKGVGEAGCIASPAAVSNAVIDAVSHLGVENLDMPHRGEQLWRVLHERQNSYEDMAGDGRSGGAQ